MPRAGSIEIISVAGNTAYRMTPVGIEQLKQLALVGTPIKEIAEFFGVSDDWVRNGVVGDPLMRDAYQQSEGDGKLELRQAGHKAAVEGDARVLTFMMERRLRMNKTVEHEHNHKIKLIGAVPDYKLSADEWSKRFAPQLEAPVVDAEYEDVSDEVPEGEGDDDDGRGSPGSSEEAAD